MIGFVALLSAIFFVWLTTSSLLKSEAAISRASISTSVAEDQVSFVVASNDKADRISAVDLVVEVTNGSLDSWSNCTSLDTSATYPFTELLSKKGKTARYSCGLIKPKDQLPSNVVLKGDVTCSTSSPATVTILKQTSVTGPVEGGTYELEKFETATVTCDGKEGDGGTQTYADFAATFEPDSCETGANSTCDYKLNISATQKAKRISAVYVKLGYDGDVLDPNIVTPDSNVLGAQTLLAQTNPSSTLVTPTPTFSPVPATTTPATTPAPTAVVSPTTTPTSAITPTPTKSIPPSTSGCEIVASDELKDGMQFLYICQETADSLPTDVHFNLSFSTRAEGKGQIKIESIQVVGPDTVSQYSVRADTASYAIGAGTGKGNVELDMKLRLQCVVHKPKRNVPVKVRFGLKDAMTGKPQFETVQMKFNDKGHLIGTVSFNVKDFTKPKSLLVKYQYGMQKNVCDSNPREDFPGAYRGCDKAKIILKPGKNVLDFSNIILLTGDLPPDEQDGISNSKDYSLVRNLIGKKDAESLELGDLNFDGNGNVVDLSCLNAALAIRWDED